MTVWYNEHDPFAAAWLRELMKDGHIPAGEVDERSIEDISPNDIKHHTQCHFFAGIGIWPLALREAGWPDDRPIWTGSCPCQPFSAAGKGGGFADERHLWPAFFHLIEKCGPERVLGEQVASKDGLAWLDLVQADLEGAGYATGAVDTCAAGFGAPHIRQRLYWLADADGRDARAERQQRGREQRRQPQDGRAVERVGNPASARHQRPVVGPEGEARDEARLRLSGAGSRSGRLADAGRERYAGRGEFRDVGSAAIGDEGAREERQRLRNASDDSRTDGRLADADNQGPQGRRQPERERAAERSPGAGVLARRLADAEHSERWPEREVIPEAHGRDVLGRSGDVERPAPTNGYWRSVDWLGCRDGKWRPVEPGTFPLAHAGTFRNRVAALRGAGNALNLAQAKGFIRAYLEIVS